MRAMLVDPLRLPSLYLPTSGTPGSAGTTGPRTIIGIRTGGIPRLRGLPPDSTVATWALSDADDNLTFYVRPVNDATVNNVASVPGAARMLSVRYASGTLTVDTNLGYLYSGSCAWVTDYARGVISGTVIFGWPRRLVNDELQYVMRILGGRYGITVS